MNRRSFLARVWAKLLDFERERGLLPPGGPVLAAVSGGPDSVVMAHYLARRAKTHGFPLELAHVHHGLRGKAADRDEAFCRALAKSLGAGFRCLKADVKGRAKRERRSLEDAGRAERYDALRGLADATGARAVAVAHTLSDHAETVVLHLLRGTEPDGLLGIPVKRGLGKSLLIRPLLCLTRDEVMEYLEFFKLKARTDTSNSDEAFTRNWVRRRVIPLLKKKSPRLEEHLGLLSSKLGQRLAGGR